MVKQSTLKWSSDYWDISKLDSYNKTFNFILSGRGSGKTVRLKKKVFDNWIKKKESFMWVLRSDVELDKSFYQTFMTFFEDIDHLFEFKGNTLLCKETGVIVGLFASMSNINTRVRKIHINNLSTIVFDEFIINPYAQYTRYKKNEVDDFFNAYETVARNYNYKTKVYWLGNPIVITNPYFINLKIDSGKVKDSLDKIYIPHEHIAVDYFSVPEVILESKLKTPYAQTMKLMDNRFYESVFLSEEQHISNVKIEKIVPDKYRLIAEVKHNNTELFFFTNGHAYHVSNKKATRSKDQGFVAFDISQWDGRDITIIDRHNHMKPILNVVLRAIRNNNYSVNEMNVHYVVEELISLLR